MYIILLYKASKLFEIFWKQMENCDQIITKKWNYDNASLEK